MLARKARSKGRRIYTLGVGRRAASMIPLRTPDGKQVVDLYKDELGDFLTTSMEPENLQRLANISNGDFWHLGKEKLGRRFVEKMLAELNQSGLSTVAEKQPYALSPWLLLAAFTVFLVSRVNCRG